MRLRPLLWLLVVLWVPLVSASPQTQLATPQLHGLDDYVQQVMHDWHVPGLAIAVVKDGKVVLAKGFGVRELGKPGNVNADTLFEIGSISKEFTAAALGTLVSSKKLTWDTPVVDVLTDFRLVSPYVTQNITLRDLLTHHSGYCDPEAAWYIGGAADSIHRMRYQTPNYGFRTTFCYNNVQYFAAGQFIPSLTGKSWNDYVAEHLFQPLGMTRTVTTEAGIEVSTNVATPHGMENGEPVAIHRYWPHNADIFAAVGGIRSSANDMSHWLQMLLADGSYDGKLVLAPAVVKAMETPQVVIQRGGSGIGDAIRVMMPDSHFYTYGLGLFVQSYHGHKLVWHSGDIDGMASALVMVPDVHLGIVVLSNMNQSNARFAVIARVLQSMLDLPTHDLEASLLARAKEEQKQSEATEKKLADTRIPESMSPLPLATYAGTYKSDLEGTARVEMDKGRLVLRLGNPDFTGDLQHWHGNTFRVTWRYRFYGNDYVTFAENALGRPDQLTLAKLSIHYLRTEQSGHPPPSASQ